MYQRLIQYVLSVMIAPVLLVACGGDGSSSGSTHDESALALYNSAAEKVNNAEGLAWNDETTTTLDNPGQSTPILRTVGTTIIDKPAKGNLGWSEKYADYNADGALLGTYEYYVKDEIFYVKTSHEQYKYKMDNDEIEEFLDYELLDVLDKDNVTDASSTSEDGNKVVSFSLALDAYKDVFDDLIDSFDDYNELSGFTRPTPLSRTITATLDSNDNITQVIITTVVEITLNGQKATVTETSKVLNLKQGRQTITFPDDLNTYPDF